MLRAPEAHRIAGRRGALKVDLLDVSIAHSGRRWDLDLSMLSDYDNISIVIRSFGNRLAEDLFHDRVTGATRRFPPDLKRAAQRKLQYLNAAVRLHDLAMPPGNRLEGLRGDRRGFHAIRINDQWRIVFRWDDDGVSGVEVTDYH